MSAVLKRCAPPPAVAAFAVLLVVMFGASYAIGSAFGPVAPGMHSTSTWNDDDVRTGEHGGAHGGGGR